VATAPRSATANIESYQVSYSTIQTQRRNSVLVEPQIALRTSQDPDPHRGKRRKINDDSRGNIVADDNHQDEHHASAFNDNSTVGQIQTKTREFPQRKKKKMDQDVHQLQPLSTERVVSGVWKQIFSGVELTPSSLVYFVLICNSSTRLAMCKRAICVAPLTQVAALTLRLDFSLSPISCLTIF
jgi:hypothetical protein